MRLVGCAINAEARSCVTGDTKHTRLHLITATDYPINILEVGVTFDGVSSTEAPVDVTLLRQTDSGSGGGTVVTPVSLSGRMTDTTLQTTAKSDATVFTNEPTPGDILWTAHIHPQGGMIWRPPALLSVPDASFLGLKVDVGSITTLEVRAYIIFEE